MPLNPNKENHIYLIHMYKEDLALNNLQWLICHKTKSNQTNLQYISLSFSFLYKCIIFFIDHFLLLLFQAVLKCLYNISIIFF